MHAVLSGGAHGATGPLVVLKFGSSLLDDAAGYRIAAGEIEREVRLGRRVVAVVSAMRGTTDRLLAAAGELSNPAPHALVASLLGTGEDASVALLGIVLTARGVNAHAVSAAALRLTTVGPIHDAEPVGLDDGRVAAWLDVHDVVIVPGFVGRDASGVPSLLGRGGSDLTALFLGRALAAEEVRLVKDVDGVHAVDPRLDGGGGPPLATATWSEVARVGNGVVQEKALRFAERHGIRFRVASPGGRGTLVGGEAGP